MPQSPKNLPPKAGTARPASSTTPSAGQAPGLTGSDPFMIAAILGSFAQERNPIHALVGDVTRRIQLIANLGKNRRAAELRITQLQTQVNRMESAIASATEQPTGHRFNRLR